MQVNGNLDPNKQAQEVAFSRKMKKMSHPPLNFNNNSVNSFKNIWGFIWKIHWTFLREHLRNIFKKVNITISLLRKLQNNLVRAPLVIIYKFFKAASRLRRLFI